MSGGVSAAAGIGVVCLLALAPTGAAGGFCERLAAAADGEIADDGFSPPTLPTAESCGQSLGFDGASLRYCRWPFPFRSAKATAAFDALGVAVAGCSGRAAEAGLTVNHPDSHTVRQHSIAGATVSVSLKDKAAEGRSWVFLTIERSQAR